MINVNVSGNGTGHNHVPPNKMQEAYFITSVIFLPTMLNLSNEKTSNKPKSRNIYPNLEKHQGHKNQGTKAL